MQTGKLIGGKMDTAMRWCGKFFAGPRYLHNGHQLLEELRLRINLAEGHDLELDRVGALLGVSRSTLSNWCGHYENPAVQLVFGLLERRCRVHPTLEHPALAHEPAVIEHLRFLLQATSGLTMIAGRSESARSFVIGALGHSFPRQDPRHRPVAGISCMPCGKFVPDRIVPPLSGLRWRWIQQVSGHS